MSVATPQGAHHPDVIVTPDVLAAADRVRTKLPVTRDEIALALARYRAGWPRSAIAGAAYIHVTTLDLWRRQSGIPIRGRGPAPQRVSPDYLKRAITLYQELGSISKVAERMGRCPSTTRVLLRRHAPDVLRRPDERTQPVPDGWETALSYALRNGRARSTVYRACRDGRLPGAVREHGDGRWIVPKGTPDVLRASERRARFIAQAQAREATQGVSFDRSEWLPAGPFVDWIQECGQTLKELADGIDAFERNLRRMLSGEQRLVSFAWADDFLLTRGVYVNEVWEDVEAAVAEGDQIRRDSIAKGVATVLEQNRGVAA